MAKSDNLTSRDHSQSIITYSVSETTAQIIALSVIVGSSLVGNLLCLTIVYRNGRMRTPQYLFMANLAGIYVLSSAIAAPFTLVTAMRGRWVFSEGTCKFQAFSVSMFFLGAIFTMTAMAMERYFAIVRPLSRFMTPEKAKRLILLQWILCLVITVQPVIGWGSYAYNRTTFSCGITYPKSTDGKLFLMVMVLFGFIIPLFVMLFSYPSIFMAVKSHAKRIRCFNKGQALSSALQAQKHLVVTNVIIVLVFLTCWLPFVLLCVLASINSDVTKLPRGLGVAAYWCGYSAAALNPLIFCNRNKRIKEGAKQVLSAPCKFFCGLFIAKEDDL